jgi:hypothetical protein
MQFSISQIAEGLGADRKTVARRLAESGAQPSGKRAGYPVYGLTEIIRAMADHTSQNATGTDPDRMQPFQRRAWFQSELARLELETAKGDLMRREHVAAAIGAIFGPMIRELETLSDRSERDLRIRPELVEYIRREVRATREAMARALQAARFSDIAKPADKLT